LQGDKNPICRKQTRPEDTVEWWIVWGRSLCEMRNCEVLS
jgi:hypothetical protein